MGLRKVIWLLRHPLSSPPWMTEDDEERDNREWQDLSGGYGGRGGGAAGAAAAAGVAEDDLETEEAPRDPAP